MLPPPRRARQDLPSAIPTRLNDDSLPRTEHAAEPPLISCLMPTLASAEAVAPALLGFLQQTYPNRQLVIALSQDSPALRNHLRALGRPEIRLVAAAAPGADLDALAALALDAADGDLICHWDSLDLHDPRRLAVQYAVLRQTGAQACLMRRPTLWDPQGRRLAVSRGGQDPRSLLALRAALRLHAGTRIATFDLPPLLLRREANAAAWSAASELRQGPAYEEALAALGQTLPAPRASPWPAPRRSPEGHDGPSRTETAGGGVRLYGHMTAAIGLAVAARGAAAALDAAGLAVDVIDIPLAETRPEPLPATGKAIAADGRWIVDLVHTNPDILAAALADGSFGFPQGARVADLAIGAWAWEGVEGPPGSWRAAAAQFDEIWAPSVFAAGAIATGIDTPVTVMPHVVVARPGHLGRAALGLPADAFVFLTAFDATSNVWRKNPAGVIAAFQAAFPTPGPGVRLVIKAKKLSPGELNALECLAGSRGDIQIINQAWDGERAASLMNACDAYVSLHRAEGFGLGMAEAMALGKPVIATAYSGNLDFMSDQTALLAPYVLGRLTHDDGPYAAGSRGADVDIAAAAQMMAGLAAQPDHAARLGHRAARWIEANLSAAAIGRRMAERLVVLREAKLSAGRAPA